jgi:ubiquitin C-terminal hydrolase
VLSLTDSTNSTDMQITPPSPSASPQNVLDNDFVLLPEGAYTLLKEWYKGGPDFPRRVVEVGAGAARETRVQLHPYFVSYSSGDSPYHAGTAKEKRGGEALMLDRTMPAGRLVAELCKAAGVEPRYADVFFLVERPAAASAAAVTGADALHHHQQQQQEQQAPQPPLPASMVAEVLTVTVPVPAAKRGGAEEKRVVELHKLARAAIAEDAALTLEDLFYGQTRPRAFVENRRWRFELRKDDAVDACDSDNDWYDSVVLEVIPPSPQVEAGPAAPPAPAPASSSTGTAMQQLPHIQMEEADADGSGSGEAGKSTSTSTTTSTTALGAGVVAGASSTAATGPVAAEAQDGDGDEEDGGGWQPQVKIHFRCWSSRFDTSLPVTSRRLQPLFSRAPDWRRFSEGMVLEVKSPRDNRWYPGRVLAVREAERRVLVCSEGDVAPAAAVVGGSGGVGRTLNGSPPPVRERWYSFDSEELCRKSVHIKREQSSPSPSPRGKRLSSLSSSSSSALAGSNAAAGALSLSSSGAAAGGQGYVLGSGSATGAVGGLSLSSSGGGLYGSRPRREPGVVGLTNLGNTCFMNSMLQCLSNTGVLTEYFLAGRHEGEVNEGNPMGMKGMLARVYARLLQGMWVGDTSPVSPVEFKRIISQFAPQFAGYQQHDSQELMGFLLDGLHEDLNRVREKPYIATPDYDGEPDALLAGEAWRRHLLRNDSVVVDRCHGQYRSHMTCPKCGHESVAFDPYLSVTVPIPVTSMVRVAFTFFPLPLGSPPVHAAATIPSAGTASALKAWIANNLCRPRVGARAQAGAALLPLDDGDDNGEGGGDGMVVVEEQGRQGGDRPLAAMINLTEVLEETRVYLDIPDTNALTAIARPSLRLHAYELERPATVFPLQHANTGGKGLSGYRLGGRRSPSPPRTAGAAADARGPSPIPAAAAATPEKPEVALLTLQFVKTGGRTGWLGSGKTYERFGVPARFALPVAAGTTNAAVHAHVWAAVRRFVKDETLTESRRPYALLLGNTLATSVDASPLPDDAEPFNFRAMQGKVLLAAFEQAEYMDYVDVDQLKRTEAHPSVRRDSLDGSGPGAGTGAGGGGRKAKAIDLRQCLEKFAEREQLGAEDPWYCCKCKERLQAYKKMDLWSCPDVLILHLKRFSYVQGASSFYSHTREKIEDLVTFPLEGLDLSGVMRGPVDPQAPPVYDLYAVSEHVGGLGGGHYTAVARNFKSGVWHAFNDSYVAPIEPARLQETVVTPRAYVLFYRRRQGSLRWGGAKLPDVPPPVAPVAAGDGGAPAPCSNSQV